MPSAVVATYNVINLPGLKITPALYFLHNRIPFEHNNKFSVQVADNFVPQTHLCAAHSILCLITAAIMIL